jgi:hypothetical protein
MKKLLLVLLCMALLIPVGLFEDTKANAAPSGGKWYWASSNFSYNTLFRVKSSGAGKITRAIRFTNDGILGFDTGDNFNGDFNTTAIGDGSAMQHSWYAIYVTNGTPQYAERMYANVWYRVGDFSTSAPGAPFNLPLDAQPSGVLRGKAETYGLTQMTDGNETTSYNLGGGTRTWELGGAYTIDSYLIKSNTSNHQIFFYDASGTVIGTWTVNDSLVPKNMTPVKGVTRVSLKSQTISEFDLYGSLQAPPPPVVPKGIDVSLIRGRNEVLPKIAIMNYDEPRIVNTSDILPYSYNTAPKLVK